MKQLIHEFIPDKNAVWKMAALVLLFLLVVTLIGNSVVPLVRAFASAFPADGEENKELTTRLVAEDDTTAQLYGKIAQLEAQLAGEEKECTDLQNELAEISAKYNQELEQLREEIVRKDSEIAENQASVETIMIENEALTLELEAIREKLSKDYVIVIKICRTGLLGAEETTYYDWHVDAEEYTKHQVGEQVHPFNGLDFPTSGNWNAVIMNMYIETIEV